MNLKKQLLFTVKFKYQSKEYANLRENVRQQHIKQIAAHTHKKRLYTQVSLRSTGNKHNTLIN